MNRYSITASWAQVLVPRGKGGAVAGTTDDPCAAGPLHGWDGALAQLPRKGVNRCYLIEVPIINRHI